MKRALPGILFAGLVVLVYADPLLARRNFLGRDILGYILPVEKTVHDAWGRGQIPVWDESVSGGRPLLPNPNSGSFYPVRLALALVPFPDAMRLFPVFHWILSGLGVILLLRSLGVTRGAAFLGAVTYVFSGVGVTENVFTNDHPGAALLPWILWAYRREGGSFAARAALLGLFLGLDMLAGDVFTVGLAIAACACWIFFETQRETWMRQLVLLAVGLGLAGFLAAPQILATALWASETDRGVLGIRLSEVVMYAISPWRLLELAIPFPFGPTWDSDGTLVWGARLFGDRPVGFFATLYAGVAALVGAVAAWKERRPGVRFARAFLLLCLALSVPLSLLPPSWGSAYSPVALRYPEKFAVGMVFALALLAARGLDVLRARGRMPRWPLIVAGGCALLVLVARAAPVEVGRLAVRAVGGGASAAASAADAIAPALAEGGLGWVATFVALELLARPRRSAQALGLVLLTGVPLAVNRRIASTAPEGIVFSRPALVRYLDRADPQRLYRVLGAEFTRSKLVERRDDFGLGFAAQTWMDQAPTLWGRGTVFQMDFDHGDLSRFSSLRKIAAALARSPSSADFFGGLALRWSIRFRDQPGIPGFWPFHRVGNNLWLEHERPLPDTRLLERWREEAGALEAARALGSLDFGEVALETGATRRGTARPGSLWVLERTPERLRLETNTLDPTWLFLLRGYWSYREVRVDGEAVQAVPACLAFSAVRVPEGRHRVDWVERVPGLEVSRWGPVLFVLVWTLLVLREKRRGFPPGRR